MNKSIRKITSISEIGRMTVYANRAQLVEVVLSVSQSRLFQRYLLCLSNHSRDAIFRDYLFFLFMQMRILFTCPKLFGLTPFYDPEKLDAIQFSPQENGQVLVKFHPIA